MQQYEETGTATNFLNEALKQVSVFVRNPWLPPRWSQEAVSAALVGHWWQWAYATGLVLSVAAGIAIIGEWITGRRLELVDRPHNRPRRP